jgi:hypothetical protein
MGWGCLGVKSRDLFENLSHAEKYRSIYRDETPLISSAG